MILEVLKKLGMVLSAKSYGSNRNEKVGAVYN
jgi:hypothetical protein